MRLIDELTAVALTGSRPGDSLMLRVWRGGRLMLDEPLDVLNWSADDSAADNQKVGQQVSFTVADPDGTLGAWRFDDPLSVAGTQLQLIYLVGGAGAINYGWFRVTANEPDEVVEAHVIDEYGYKEPDGSLPEHKRWKFTTRAVVRLDAVDLTVNVDRDKFEFPESPKGPSPTAVGEFRRLTADYFPTVVDAGVVDTPVSGQLVYDRERLDACQDLLGRVSARYRMGGDGECHIYPYGGAPVLRVEPGNALVSVKRKQSLDGLYNRWVVEGKDGENGQPVRGAVSIETGPLRYGGPHGKAPYFYSSEMITTQAQAEDYAAQLRDKALNSLAVELAVSIIPRPELQGGDRIEVGCPVAAGHVAYIPGEIISIRRGGDTLPRETTLTVRCSYSDVLFGLARTDWAQYLTDELPPLTWDRMPSTWGSGPVMTWAEAPA